MRPRTQSPDVGALELFAAAAVVGTPTLAGGGLDYRPFLEMLWRVAMVASYVRPAGDAWIRSSTYDRLDPSEKTAVSYFLGMVQAEVVARRVLGYSHLVHVDVLLRAQGSPLSGKRPDFVALQIGRRGSPIFSATLEAKGRTNGFDGDALRRAKAQARVIPAIAGLVPRETIASEAYFSDAGGWSSALVDPESDGVPLEIGVETYLLTYYGAVIEAGRQAETWTVDDEVAQFELAGFPLSVRIPVPLVVAYDKSNNLPIDQRELLQPILQACYLLSDTSDNDEPTDFLEVSPRADAVSADLIGLFEAG